MRLYHSAMSISLACRLALTAAGADHEIVAINSMAGETAQEPFLAVNPLGQVPVLESDGARLTQAVAILSFIADRTGHGWPYQTALERAQALSIMVLTAVDVQGSWTMNNRPERFVDTEAGRSQIVAHARVQLEKAYNEIERKLGLMAETRELGVLDYYVAVFALWKSMVPEVCGGFAATPRLDAVKERVMSQETLRRVIDDDIAVFTARLG